jgi:DNA-binding response OmpR family regulator/tRNA A-37 threonylcarbamoyl transferase component Bud32
MFIMNKNIFQTNLNIEEEIAEDETSDLKLSETQILENSNPVKILCIERDGAVGKTLTGILQSNGYTVTLADSAWDAFEKILDHNFDIIISDSDIPGTSCQAMIRYCKKHHPMQEIIIISQKPQIAEAVQVIKDGAFDYLSVPFDEKCLLEKIKAAHQEQINNLVKTVTYSVDEEASSRFINPLPGYEMVKKLGNGSSGVILLVNKGSQKFALKMLRHDLHGNQSGKAQIERFLREAEILSQIDHPNVVKIYESGISANGSIPYILMEYINGSNLTWWIKNRSISVRKKVKILLKICNALHAIHQCGILHRDIKPGNIMLRNDLTVKLTDFGIARIIDSSQPLTLEVIGSPAYMAPESFIDSHHTDHRSEIFSLGILAYEFFTGIKPFTGSNLEEMIQSIKNEKPDEPTKMIPDLPVEIQFLIGKMLCKKPDDRFQSVDEIIYALESLLKRNPAGTSHQSKSLISLLLGKTPVKYWS